MQVIRPDVNKAADSTPQARCIRHQMISFQTLVLLGFGVG